ncbi:MAG: BMP family ABC transporter substrate-binding protein [Bacillota bacterium]
MLRNKKLFVVLSVLLVLALLVPGCSSGSKAKKDEPEKMKVAFMYVGPVGDAGWTFEHDRGRKYLQDHLSWVETSYVESVPEGADAERVLTELAEKGNKVIFATSFGYMDYVIKVAAKYPNVVFMHCSGYKTAANVGTYFGQIEQPRYLSGLVAGKMTKTNVLGYVAAHPIPEVIRGANAFTLGVLSVNPKAKVKLVWTNTWYDPAAEKEAAKSLLEAGADVIAQHQDTPGPQQAAEEAGKYGIGYNSDMRSYAPKANLTSPIWNWGPYYVKTVQAVKDGTWKNDQFWGDMNDGVVDLGPFGDAVPEDVKQLVEKAKQDIKSGKLVVFAGPLKDQKGVVRVKEGTQMTGDEILNMNWFVKGIVGTIPTQ